MLRRIFGSKMEEVAGGWRRPHNEELHNLYASPYIIRVSNQGRYDGRGMLKDWKKRGMHTLFLLENLAHSK
jgi:hypothetical protein